MEIAELEAEVCRLKGENATLRIERNQAIDLAESLRTVNLVLSDDLVKTTTDLREIKGRIESVISRARGT